MENEAIQMECVENSSENVGCKCRQRIMGSLKGRGKEEITERKFLRKLRVGDPLTSISP